MSEGKKRSKSQIIGEKAVSILRALLPIEWIIREYAPDYGIDLAVELFEPHKENFITTGEHVYFQVKGTEELKIGKLRVNKRSNVEKAYSEQEFYKNIEVVKFNIETALLGTVEKMGSAVPVLLVVVDVVNNRAYFMCLNDYIEKVILPINPNYAKKKSLTINIPISNVIENTNNVLPIRWYAKRAKLFALFSKANYQRRELEYMSDKTLTTDILHFSNIIRRFDAWGASKYFYALAEVQAELDYFLNNKTTKMAETIIENYRRKGEDVEDKCWMTRGSFEELSLIESQNAIQLRILWDRICNCGFIFEDLSKEWFLPTYAGLLTSEQ
ncbi:DUF4365 domain-containing protein [Clostridium aminobutyricum]|uniref:DUF4365 domain-containing protein n=1 Tax=Clostridium aminobutyricum TaxID=33953 RepID=A0A939IJJ0_CLOAM|nr:DUF4365 domain-containing protein [Clostridium aminobutyricum]MBN7774146.1 DUF4365 domain-containing protein [Clostridium aminobutyricum]